MKIDNMKFREIELTIRNGINKMYDFAEKNPEYQQTVSEIEIGVMKSLITTAVTALLFESSNFDNEKSVKEIIDGYLYSKYQQQEDDIPMEYN